MSASEGARRALLNLDLTEDLERLAAEILKAHRQPPEDQWNELIARIWTLLSEAYNQVRDTAHFIFRDDNAKRSHFPSLFAADKSASPRGSPANHVSPEPGPK